MDNKGYSLIEVTISAAIMSTMALGLATLVSQLGKQQHYFSQKFESMEFTQTLQTLLTDDKLCSGNFKDLTFDATDSKGFFASRSKLYTSGNSSTDTIVEVGKELNGTQTGLTVDGIKLGRIKSTSDSDKYTAELFVFWATKKNTNLKPSTIPIVVETDPTSPKGAKKIKNCGLSGLASVTKSLTNLGCMEGDVVGFGKDGDVTCMAAASGNESTESNNPGSGVGANSGANCSFQSMQSFQNLSIKHLDVVVYGCDDWKGYNYEGSVTLRCNNGSISEIAGGCSKNQDE